MIDELEVVTLRRARPGDGLAAGDVGTVVMVHGGGKGYTVEFMTAGGETTAIVDFDAADIRIASPAEIDAWRGLAAAE